MIVLATYLIGIVLAFLACFAEERKKYKNNREYELTLANLVTNLFMVAISWITVIAYIIYVSDKVVLFRKR